MKTTLFTLLTVIACSFLSSAFGQSENCPKQNKMKEGSCIMIDYPSADAAAKAVSAPAEILIVSESTDEVSNGTYIAQYNCNGTEVIYTKASPCNCSDYSGTVAGTFTFMQSEMTCKFDAAGVLPVEFKFFKAEKQGDMTRLEWATNSESDNEGFYVERSSDGKFFQEFTFIVGEGNSTATITYDALDRSPDAGVNYYRLKQVDYNGNERYSDIAQVDFRESGATIVNFDSAREELTIRSDKSLQKIEIFDMAGVRVYKGNFSKSENEHSISLSGQQTGHFVAVITTEQGTVETTKFAKL